MCLWEDPGPCQDSPEEGGASAAANRAGVVTLAIHVPWDVSAVEGMRQKRGEHTAGIVVPAGLAMSGATKVGLAVEGEVSGRDAGGEERGKEDGELHDEGG